MKLSNSPQINSLMNLDTSSSKSMIIQSTNADSTESKIPNKNKTIIKEDMIGTKKPNTRLLLNQRVCHVEKDMLGVDGVNIADPEQFRILMLILKKLPYQRFDEELEYVHLAFEKIKFFMEIKKDLEYDHYLNLFRELTVEEFKSGQRILSYGDMGRKFYVILKGSVYILLKKQSIYPENLRKIKKRVQPGISIESDYIRNHIFEFTDEMTEDEKQNILTDFIDGFFVSRILESGSSFGEIALQTSGPRTATIVCREDTVVGVLSYDAYKKFLSRIDRDHMEDTMKFFKSMDLFGHWNNNEIRSFLMNIEKRTSKKHHLIYQENEDATHIYFIKDGEIELSCPIEDNLEDLSNNNDEFKHYQKIKKRYKQTKLGLIGAGQFFGESEIIKNQARTTRAKCFSQECVYFAISKDKFFNTIKDPKTLQILINHSKRKEEWHKILIQMTKKTNENLDVALNQIKPKESSWSDADFEFPNYPWSTRNKESKANTSKILENKFQKHNSHSLSTSKQDTQIKSPIINNFNISSVSPNYTKDIRILNLITARSPLNTSNKIKSESNLKFKNAGLLLNKNITDMVVKKYDKFGKKYKEYDINLENGSLFQITKNTKYINPGLTMLTPKNEVNEIKKNFRENSFFGQKNSISINSLIDLEAKKLFNEGDKENIIADTGKNEMRSSKIYQMTRIDKLFDGLPKKPRKLSVGVENGIASLNSFTYTPKENIVSASFNFKFFPSITSKAGTSFKQKPLKSIQF